MLYNCSVLELLMSDLSIKGVPEAQVLALRERATRNHRSLQGELRAIIDAALAPQKERRITLDELAERGRQLGLKSASEAPAWIRELRDSR
jgi:plasmid stability protein